MLEPVCLFRRRSRFATLHTNLPRIRHSRTALSDADDRGCTVKMTPRS